jgi:hypothetical protein
MPDDIIRRFHAAIPQVSAWMDQYIQTHAASARQISTLGFKRLPLCYPKDLLERAKVVSVDRVPYPPVESFGLPEFAPMQQMSFDGITFKDTFFIQSGRESEELLHFHELVHVVQWTRLGVDKFLLAYGLGLLQFGYEQSPLEVMAFDLQRRFTFGMLPNNLVEFIEQATDNVWSHAAQLVQATPYEIHRLIAGSNPYSH